MALSCVLSQHWAGREECFTHHLAFLLPGALGHHSGTNAIKLFQSDLLNFSGPLVLTIGKKKWKTEFLLFILESIFFPALLVA